MTTNPAQAFIDLALDQIGDRYKFGAEATGDDADPSSWDSGELVEWAANRAGMEMPDGTWKQYQALHERGSVTDTEVALRTPGALLFSFSSDPLVKGAIPGQRQVMISLGDGRVIEVSPRHGVRVIEADAKDFTHAAILPNAAAETESDTLAIRAHVDGRLKELGFESRVAEGVVPGLEDPRPPTVASGPGTEAAAPPAADAARPQFTREQAVDLSKRAIDTRQEAEALRVSAENGVKHQRSLEEQAQAKLDQAESKVVEADHAFEEARAARVQAEQLELRLAQSRADLDEDQSRLSPDEIRAREEQIAALATSAEGARTTADTRLAHSSDLNDEAGTLRQEAAILEERADQAEAAVKEVRAESDARFEQSRDFSMQSIEAVAGSVGLDVGLHGAGPFGEPATTLNIPQPLPAAPPAGASEADIRAWIAAREAVLQSHEDAASESDYGAASLDDLAESRRLVAVEADAKAATAQHRVDAERTRLGDLGRRIDEAESQGARYTREYEEERAQFDRLTEVGDTGGAALAGARADRLFQQRISWDLRVGQLQARRAAAEETIRLEEENATEYAQIATSLRVAADEASVAADAYEVAAREHRDVADRIDFVDDSVETAIGSNVRTRIHIVGEEELEIEIPGRDPRTLTPSEFDEFRENLPGGTGTETAPTQPEPETSPDDPSGVPGVTDQEPAPASASAFAAEIDESVASLVDPSGDPTAGDIDVVPTGLETLDDEGASAEFAADDEFVDESLDDVSGSDFDESIG